MTADVPPQLLRALLATLDAGSLTAASERLGFTQSALSKQIGALEAAVGAALFLREARGVVPTAAARALAPRAQAILDQYDALERDLTGSEEELAGRVALGGFPTTAMHLVPRALADVAREHPGLDVVFLESSTPLQVRRLRAGRIDLAIIAGGTDSDLSGLVTEPLASGRPCIAVGEQHPLARAARVAADDLEGERWIVGRTSRGEPQFGAWPSVADPDVVASLEGWTSRFGFVAAGLGITTIPALARPALPRGVVAVPVDPRGWTGQPMLLAHRGSRSRASQAVADAVSSTAARMLDAPGR